MTSSRDREVIAWRGAASNRLPRRENQCGQHRTEIPPQTCAFCSRATLFKFSCAPLPRVPAFFRQEPDLQEISTRL